MFISTTYMCYCILHVLHIYVKLFLNFGRKMDDEYLIKMVRQHSELYDLSHPKYMDSNFKIDVWNKIGQQLNMNSTSCKSRWNNIRDNYRKSLKKLTTKSRRGSKKLKFYKYSQQLSFLNKYFDDRKNKGNIESQEGDEDCFHKQEVFSEVEDQEYIHIKESDEMGIGDDLQRRLSPNSFTNNAIEVERKTIIPKSKKKRAIQQLQTNSTKLMPNAIYDSETTSSAQHSVDAFLAGLAPTLKALNPFYLNLAKSEIFGTVQKYELKMLEQQHSHQESFLNVNRNIMPQCDHCSTSAASGSV